MNRGQYYKYLDTHNINWNLEYFSTETCRAFQCSNCKIVLTVFNDDRGGHIYGSIFGMNWFELSCNEIIIKDVIE